MQTRLFFLSFPLPGLDQKKYVDEVEEKVWKMLQPTTLLPFPLPFLIQWIGGAEAGILPGKKDGT